MTILSRQNAFCISPHTIFQACVCRAISTLLFIWRKLKTCTRRSSSHCTYECMRPPTNTYENVQSKWKKDGCAMEENAMKHHRQHIRKTHIHNLASRQLKQLNAHIGQGHFRNWKAKMNEIRANNRILFKYGIHIELYEHKNYPNSRRAQTHQYRQTHIHSSEDRRERRKAKLLYFSALLWFPFFLFHSIWIRTSCLFLCACLLSFLLNNFHFYIWDARAR